MTKDVTNNLLDYSLVSERIHSFELETTTGSLTIFQIYAPDSSYTDINNGMFYDQLQDEFDKLNPRNKYVIFCRILMLMLAQIVIKIGQQQQENLVWEMVMREEKEFCSFVQ